jgi:gliding motility-associated lipoprotein GldH
MTNHRKQLRLSALALCLGLIACGGDTWFHRYQSAGKDGWARTDTLTFALPPLSADTVFDAFVGLRITHSFPYQRLWMALEVRNDSVGTTFTDTLCYELCDSAGRFSGRGVTSLQYEQPFMAIPLPAGSANTLLLYHLMKKETVPSVKEVGVRLSGTVKGL